MIIPVSETVCATLVWGGGVIYSLYSLHVFGNDFNGPGILRNYHYGDFAPGWFGRYRDVSDFEWNCWTRLTLRLLPWLLLNLLVGIIGRASKYQAQCVCLSQALISLLAFSYILRPASAGLFIFIIATFHLLAYFNHPLLICLVGWLWRRYFPTSLLAGSDEELYLIEVAGSWLILRCLAYSFEVIRGHPRSFPLFLGYAFYLPTAFCGPILPLSSFVRHMNSLPPRINLPWLSSVILSFTRCILWFVVTTVALHYVYPNAILLRPYMVVGMTLWQLAGLGIAMGHFFHLKYVVFYGIPSCWATAEGYSTLPSPCCVSRVYLYSVMWRRFDPGLYAFLVRYIYIPVLHMCKQQRIFSKIVASVACFFFVFVWHGEEEYVLYWVILNFTAVTIEGFVKEVNRLPSVRERLDETLNEDNQRRMHCLLAAPLHYFSMLSNYFFIGSLDIGKIYFNRAFRETAINNIYIMFFLYGAAQASLSIETFEKKRQSVMSRERDLPQN